MGIPNVTVIQLEIIWALSKSNLEHVMSFVGSQSNLVKSTTELSLTVPGASQTLPRAPRGLKTYLFEHFGDSY